MNKKIVSFGASISSKSINQQFAEFVGRKLGMATCSNISLRDFPLPLYSSDEEKSGGIPPNVKNLKAVLDEADAYVISFAEHNGSFTAAYKNAYDWVSRLDAKVFADKPLLLLATSPGGRGGASVLAHALSLYSRGKEDKVVQFSLPGFSANFDAEKDVITDASLQEKLNQTIEKFKLILAV
ncbi:MAG: chromate reductase [Sphingobacteriales bacterium]